MKQIRWKIAQFFEINWWKHYLKTKEPQAYLNWKTRYWLNLLTQFKLNPNLLEGHVADIGCGPAGVFMVLNKAKVQAIDPQLEAYKTLSHFRPNNYPNVNFINTSFENFESTKPFRFIFCLNAINHFRDVERSVNKLNKLLLDKEGMMLISFDTHNYTLLKWLFKLLPFLDILHPYQNDLAGYKQLLTRHGFVIKQTIALKKRFIFNYYAVLVKQGNT